MIDQTFKSALSAWNEKYSKSIDQEMYNFISNYNVTNEEEFNVLAKEIFVTLKSHESTCITFFKTICTKQYLSGFNQEQLIELITKINIFYNIFNAKIYLINLKNDLKYFFDNTKRQKFMSQIYSYVHAIFVELLNLQARLIEYDVENIDTLLALLSINQNSAKQLCEFFGLEF